MKLKEGLKIREIAGESVLIMQGQLGADMTKIISFNRTAEWLWNNLTGKDFTLEDVANLLVKHFQLDSVIAKQDAGNWIEQLKNCKALEI